VETIGSKRSYALIWCMPNNDDDDDRRDRSLTLFWNSRPWNRVSSAKDQGSSKNLVNLELRNAR